MRFVPAALPAALVAGLGPMSRAAEILAPSSLPVTQSVVTLAGGTDTILGASTSRRYLCLMNIGTGLITLAFDQAAVSGAGWAMEPAGAAGHQGGAMCWESATVTASAVHAISAAGSTVGVLEAR